MTIVQLFIVALLHATQLPLLAVQKTEHQHRATYLTNAIFDKTGTQSKTSHQEAIEQAIHNLLKATNYQKIAIAQRTAQLLENHIKERQELLEKNPANFLIEHSLFILKAQKGYLEEYYETFLATASWFDTYYITAQRWLQQLINAVQSFFSPEHKTVSFIEQTALDLDFYCYFEVEHIFTDYQKTLMLFAQQKQHRLPDIMVFWSHPLLQQEILKRVKKIDTPAKIQAEVIAAETAEALGEDALMVGGDITEKVAMELELASNEAAEQVAAKLTPAGILEDVSTSLKGDAQAFAEDAPKPGEEPAQTRTQERQAQRAQERAEAAQKNQDALNDPSVSKLKKGYIKTKMALSMVLEKTGVQKGLDWIADNITGPISDAYKKYIYERILEPLEDNALHSMLEELPEWLRGIVDIGMQMGLMMGGGLVTSWVSEADQKVYLQYAQLQTQMTAINTKIITQFAQQKALLMKSSSDALNTVINLINQTRSNQIQTTAAEILYLNQSTLNTPAKSAFVIKPSTANPTEDALQIDERFARSIMPTANLKSIWRNLFRSGNWQYMPDLKIFYQTQLVKISGDNLLEQATDCLYNSVTTEYYPEKIAAYDIVVECTLINYDTSCLVGVIFNHARWISGVPDTFNQHRFMGLYGNNNNLYAVLEESSASTDKQSPNTLSPAYKILANPNNYTQKNIVLPPAPVKLTLAINTSALKVTATMSQTTQSGNSTLAQLERTDLQTPLFNYHGLGFIAAGCIAQFKIIKPQELT
ncbi:MAG: hypothetical protein EBU90_14310 [Proteobacteria bacterium]|nr:hypothetical protein [Pseudomonadota bacterium]